MPEGRTVVVFAKGFTPTPGGVETYSEQVVRAYLRAGLDVKVLTQIQGAPGWQTRSTPDGEFELWNAGAGGQARVMWAMVAEARRIRATESVSFAHATTWRVGVVSALVFRGSPQVVTVHGREVMNYPRWAGPAMRYVVTHAECVIAISEETRRAAQSALGTGRDVAWVVAHNGLTDRERAKELERDGFSTPARILILCRLVARKNVANALRAVASVSRKRPGSVIARIAGRGPEFDNLVGLVDRESIGDIAEMLGYVPDADVPDLYDWADLFVHPHSQIGEGTDFEGFGIVMADAMAHGCLVVAGKHGGPLDYVRSGETGLLVDGNDVESIAGALLQVLDSQDQWREIARRGREFALVNFSWDRHVEAALRMLSDGVRR